MYNTWTVEKGYPKIDATVLSSLMKSKGFEKKYTRVEGCPKPVNAFMQVGLKSE
jgi:hypothetical protein